MSRNGRLAQAEECLASGMTVKDWCAANGVPTATMYAWLRRLREERECALAPAFVELGDGRSERDAAPVACAPVVVRVGGAEIIVSAGACEREVSMVMRTAASL